MHQINWLKLNYMFFIAPDQWSVYTNCKGLQWAYSEPRTHQGHESKLLSHWYIIDYSGDWKQWQLVCMLFYISRIIIIVYVYRVEPRWLVFAIDCLIDLLRINFYHLSIYHGTPVQGRTTGRPPELVDMYKLLRKEREWHVLLFVMISWRPWNSYLVQSTIPKV